MIRPRPVASTGSQTEPTPTTEERDIYAWPYATESIWNMPIGSEAVYVHAGLGYANASDNGQITYDDEFIGVNPNDPIKILNDKWRVHVPADMQRSRYRSDGSMHWNGCSAFLDEDGRTIHSGQVLDLPLGGNPSYQHDYGETDIYGTGHRGAHGGSALSSYGGSIRKGDLVSDGPMRHTLKINVYGKYYLSQANNGYHWPATKADSGYTNPSSHNFYGRTGEGYDFMGMGTLLALRPDADISFVTDPKARKMADCLRDFGGYIVDNTAWDVHAFSVERTAIDSGEWPKKSVNPAFHSQLHKLMTMLHAVTNNSATSIGGGGTPRVPLAPVANPPA